MGKIRFATIGTSSITKMFLEAAGGCPEFELTAAYSRNRQQAEQFGAAYGAVRSHDSLTELAADEEIDAVYIASPNSLHHDQAIAMMKGGKHVLCEKAMGANHREVQEMIDTANEQGVILLEAVRSLYDPGFAALQENLSQLGTIRQANFHYGKYSSRYDEFKNGRQCNIFDPQMAAGGLMDIGIYCVEPMIALFGRPEELKAVPVMLRGGIDGAGTIAVRYDGMIVELSYSKIADLETASQIAGELGTMVIPQITMREGFELVSRNGQRESKHTGTGANNMLYELQFFIDAVNGRANVDKYQEISLLSAEFMDEARAQMGVHFPIDKV